MNVAVIRNYIVEKEIIYALKKLGHNAKYISLLKPVGAFNGIDLIISTAWSHYPVPMINKLKKKGIKVAYWSRATPSLEKKKLMRFIESADYVFTPYKSKYNYLPLCASSNPKWHLGHNYKWDVCSVIRHVQNHKKLDLLKDIFRNLKRKYIIAGTNWHYHPKFKSKNMEGYNQRYRYYWNSKMSINIPKSIEALPLRYFEPSRCKNFPIFYDSELLDEIYPRKLLFTFDENTKISKIHDKIDYYLDESNKKEYRNVVSKLHKIVMSKHTYENRMKRILKVVS